MSKIIVTAYKKSGKYYTEEAYELDKFPSSWNVDQNITVKELHDLQMKECNRVWEEIKKGNMLCYCPVSNWKGFYFTFNGVFESEENGFFTYLLDRTGEE